MVRKITIYTLVLVGLFAINIHGQQCSDPAYRQAKRQFLQQLPSATQAKIWANHARYALQTEENLNDGQRAIIEEGLTLIKNENYTPEGVAANASVNIDYARRAALAFPDKTQYARIFSLLTIEELKGFSIVKASYKRLDESGTCSCNHNSSPLCDQCLWAGNLYPSCSPTQSGCGPFWILECDGQCVIGGQIQ